MKGKEADITPLVICHFEDEPGKVVLPEIIACGLDDTEGVKNTRTKWPASRARYTISFTYLNVPQLIIYLVEGSENAMKAALKTIGKRKEILYIVDTSLGSDKSAGTKIVRNLVKSGVDSRSIWMVTAYANQASRRIREMKIDVNVISKPPDTADLCDKVLQLIAEHVGKGA